MIWFTSQSLYLYIHVAAKLPLTTANSSGVPEFKRRYILMSDGRLCCSYFGFCVCTLHIFVFVYFFLNFFFITFKLLTVSVLHIRGESDHFTPSFWVNTERFHKTWVFFSFSLTITIVCACLLIWGLSFNVKNIIIFLKRH